MKSLVASFVLSALLLPFAPTWATATVGGETPASGGSAEGVIARVNDEPIYLEDAERRLQDLHSQVNQTDRSAFDLDRLMFRLVNDTLLAQEARVMGFADEEPIPGKLETLRRELAVNRLKREEVADRVDVTEEMIREAFEREQQRVTLRVLTTHERDEAEQALEDLRGGADFAELAAERSKDPYALRGGLVEDLPRLDLMREIADVAFDLEPGTLFGPVRTPIGYAVIRVEELHDADPERLDESRSELRQMLHFRQSKEYQDELAATLHEHHTVEIDREVAGAVVPERIDDGRLMPRVDDRDATVARIDERAISAGEYADALKWRWKGVRNKEAAEASAPLVLDQLVQEELLLAEALRRGYDHAPEVERKVAALEKNLLVTRYLQEVLGPMVEVETDEMKEFYEANQDRFQQPPRVHVAQITVETEEQAARLAGMLRDGADLSWLARKHSIDRFADSGGDRGWFEPSPGLDAFNDALIAADKGDVLGPFGVPGNHIVVKVMAREERGVYPFERVSGSIQSALFREKFDRALAEVLDKLRSRSEIDVYDDALASLSITGSPESGEGAHAEGADHTH